jgi:hypothetical protein
MKNINQLIPIKDRTICMHCLKNKATHKIGVYRDDIKSEFAGIYLTFNFCEDCLRQEFIDWCTEEIDKETQKYKYEKKIWKLINKLPLQGQEILLNNGYFYAEDSQEWILNRYLELKKGKLFVPNFDFKDTLIFEIPKNFTFEETENFMKLFKELLPNKTIIPIPYGCKLYRKRGGDE